MYWSGLAGGVVGSLVGHPFDTMKVLAHSSSMSTVASQYFSAPKKIILSRVMAGIGPAIASQAVIYALLFGVYDNIKDRFRQDEPAAERDSVSLCALAGGITGVVIAPVTSPLELLKCRLQVAKSNSSVGFSPSKLPAIKTMMSRGMFATAARCGFGNACFFSTIEILQSHFSKRQSFVTDLLVGSISGASYWLVAAPFDLIKSRQQTTSSLNFMQEASHVMREGGMFSLWRGCSYALLRTVPMQGAVMMTLGASLRFCESDGVA